MKQIGCVFSQPLAEDETPAPQLHRVRRTLSPKIHDVRERVGVKGRSWDALSAYSSCGLLFSQPSVKSDGASGVCIASVVHKCCG
eukprot:3460882-Rhodomonas_salina.1